MEQNSKQIYVALQLSQNDIKILVSEYFSTRFNVIRYDSYHCDSIQDYKVVDEESLVKQIQFAVKDCSNKIGADIEKVILVLPAYNFKRIPLRSSVYPENGVIKKQDIARAVSNSLSFKIDSDLMIANPVINKYTVNGIPTRRMPEKEISDEVVIDIDLLCCDRKMTIDYVSAVEKAGIKVLDIVLDSYCIVKESALLEESLKKNIIVADIEKDVTYLTLLSKGRLASTNILFDGLQDIAAKVKTSYSMNDSDLYKLLKYNVDFESQYMNDVIYAYTNDQKTVSVNTSDLNELIRDDLNEYVDKIFATCGPLIEQGAEMIVTGEGEQMISLLKLFKEKAKGNCRGYYPETIGVRNPALTALYGSFIVYREKALLNNLSVNCINLIEYDTSVKEKDLDTDGDTITSKIKNLFKQYVIKGEE